MTRNEFLDAIQSQINRYEIIQELAMSTLVFERGHLYTLVEDAFEYAQKLTDEFCVVDDQHPNILFHPSGGDIKDWTDLG